MTGKYIEQDRYTLFLLLRIRDVYSIDKIVAKLTLNPFMTPFTLNRGLRLSFYFVIESFLNLPDMLIYLIKKLAFLVG